MTIHSLRREEEGESVDFFFSIFFFFSFPSFGEYRRSEIRLARLFPTLRLQDRVKTSNDSFFQNQRLPKMLCRAVRAGHRALPFKRNIRCNIEVYVPRAKRHVTTDAASSHAEKEHVPAVSQAPLSKSRASDLRWSASSGRGQALRSHSV